MKKSLPKITVHCLVCNEERWIWFAIMSVIDYVDEILIWDNGSTDKTLAIVRSIDNPKIKIKELGVIDASTFTEVRNQMLKEVKTDWMMILDGDEIWTDEALIESQKQMTADIHYLVNSYYNLVGDLYHYQDENAGRYKIKSWTGHLNIRFINKNLIPGLHFANPYGSEGPVDTQERSIQDVDAYRTKFVESKYFHTTHLTRSDKSGVMMREPKYKYELGHLFPNDFSFPKVFYLPNVNNPWTRRGLIFVLNACWQTPLRHLKRLFI